MTAATAAARPMPKPGILDIAPYVPGKAGGKGQKVYKLSANENPLGASPAAVEAYRSAADVLEFYPDGAAHELRQAIAGALRAPAQNIVCGAGSDEILQLLAHAYLRPGDEAVYSQHGFLVYPIAIASNGATAVVARESQLTTDVDQMLSCITAKTRIVFLANPNNPDRHLYSSCGSETPACGAAQDLPPGARCRLCRICQAQRL